MNLRAKKSRNFVVLRVYIYLSIYLSTYLSVYPSIYLSVYLSIYLSIFKMYGQILQAVGKTHHNKKQYLETPGQLWAKDFSDLKKWASR